MSLSVSIRHGWPGFSLDAAFEVPGGVTALFGPSGSGKTTIANAVAGLMKPDAATITLNGRTVTDTASRTNLPAAQRRIGYVFQDGRLFPHLDVRANLAYGCRKTGTERDKAIVDIAGKLGIDHLLQRGTSALSGGERQRVAIARALLTEPDLLVMDEPLAALDEPRKAEILPLLERLRDENEVPVLYVSHSVAEVARLATSIVVMREGRVVSCGPAMQVLSDPQMVPLFGVRAAGSVLEATVLRHDEDGLTCLETCAGTLFLPQIPAPPGSKIRVRIQAQDVIIATDRPDHISALNILDAVIEDIRIGEGPGVILRLKVGSDHLLARVTRRSATALELKPGTRCHALIKSVAVAQADIWSR